MEIKHNESRSHKTLIHFFMVAFFLFQCSTASNINGGESSNLPQDFFLEHHLATKSPYWADTKSNVKKAKTEAPLPPQCQPEPIHFNWLARHGSRGPVETDWIKFEQLETSLQEYGRYITNPDFDWMKNWTNPYSPDINGFLTPLGEIEHYKIAKRFLKRYPSLFAPKYSPLLFPFQSTQKPRTSQSANSFGYGLFEDRGILGGSTKYQPIFLFSDTMSDDLNLYFFDNCPNYANKVVHNDTLKYDSKKFLEQNVDVTISKIQRKLGVSPENWSITKSDVNHMYKSCAYEVSVSQVTSRFCSLFDAQDFEMYEYVSDLEDFYIRGYGTPLAYSIACPLVVDFFDKMDQAIRSPLKSPQRAFLRFAHAETVIPFVSLLGLFDDEQNLHWNTPKHVKENRKWRMSDVSPFAANVAFLLYNCSTGNEESYRVKLLHNEEEMAFPHCKGEMYCPLPTLKSIYASSLNCDFKSLCGIKSPDFSQSDSSTTSSQKSENVKGKGGVHYGMVILVAIFTFFLGTFGASVFTTLYWKSKRNLSPLSPVTGRRRPWSKNYSFQELASLREYEDSRISSEEDLSI